MTNQDICQSKDQRLSTKARSFAGVISLCLLAACGGGAGDEVVVPDNTAAIAVSPLVGTWELPGDWSGSSNDEAFLLVRPPGANGVAEAVIFDFDDAATGLGQNCFREELPGEISQSLSNELFLDLNAFPNAIVSLNAAGNLVIEFSEDASSSTDRETTTEFISVRIGEMETSPTRKIECGCTDNSTGGGDIKFNGLQIKGIKNYQGSTIAG